MSLKRLLDLSHTLVFRLTLWYAGIFTLSSLIAFLVFYLLSNSIFQKQIDESLLEEFEEVSSVLSLKGIDVAKAVMKFEAEAEGVDKIFFRLLTPNGKEIASSDMLSWLVVGTASPGLIKGGDRVFETLTVPGQGYKTRILYGYIGPGIILQIGESLKDNAKIMETFWQTFGITLSGVIVFVVLTGWFMARGALQGVEEVIQTAMDISKGDLRKRVIVKSRSEEIDRLAITFNIMLDRIDALVAGMREMSDNIAHDLRSPVARIRGMAEITLTTAKTIKEYEVMAGSTIEECDRLLEMINTMLDISEAEAGTGKLVRDRVDFTGLVEEACDLFHPIAEDKGVMINCSVSNRYFVSGDRQRLQRMAANLVDNALKYTPQGETVTVSVNEDKGQVVFSVNDTGIGISEDDLSHIFERFYRCDQSRSQPGIGLGLSLVRAIAKAHGGDVTVTSQPGQGSAFTVTIPQQPDITKR